MGCTAKCWARVTCATCHRSKWPVGRSMPMEVTGGFCDRECAGYYQDPQPPHLFSEHDNDRAYTDLLGWEIHVANCEQCRERG